MKTEFKKLPKNLAELTIELSVEEIQPYLKKAAKKISQSLEIPGFRKGKVPYEVVKQRVGEGEILKEAIEFIVPESCFKVIKEENLEIVAQPKVDILKLAPGNPLVFKATLALLPKVKVGDYKKIRIKRPKVKIEKKQVEKVLDDLRKMRAKETLVKREAREGDKVIVDIDMFLDKVPVEGGQSRGTTIILGDSYFIPGLDKKLLGMKEGENREFSLRYRDDFYDKKLAGNLVDFKVKLNSVYQIDLPELNDEFARSLGRFKDLNNLREQIKENLELEERTENERKLELEMLEKIVEISEFDEIPDALIEREIEKMLLELKEGVESQGLKYADYLTQLKKTEEELKKEFIRPAEKRVKTALVIREIGMQNKIRASEEEIEQEINNILKIYPSNENIKKQVVTQSYRNYLNNLIINRKTIELLKKQLIID